MTIKKHNSKNKTTGNSQPDWKKWCSPARGKDIQGGLCNPNDLPESIAVCEALFGIDELFYARIAITSATDNIVPEAPDLEHYPVPSLESLEVNSERQFTISSITEQTFCKLKDIKEVWPHPKAVERLEALAKELVQLLNAARELGDRKIALANTMKLKKAAAKLTQAYKTLCMIELAGDIEKDAEQLFLEKRITPDDFRAAMRTAFKLDRDATREINNKGCIDSQSPQASTDGYTQQDRKVLLQIADNCTASADNTAVIIDKIAVVETEVKRATARKLKELQEKSKGGRKGAIAAKVSRRKDAMRENILKEVKEMLSDWDKKYPDRHKIPIDIAHSDAAAIKIVANRHKGENGKPIMSVDAIKKALQRRKKEKRGKYERIGKERGRYKK